MRPCATLAPTLALGVVLALSGACSSAGSPTTAPDSPAADAVATATDSPPPVPETPVEPPDLSVSATPRDELDAFAGTLLQAIFVGNRDQLVAGMADPFLIAHWQSEGTSLSAVDAAEQVINQLREPSRPLVVVAPQPDLAELLGMDPSALWGPDVKAERTLLTRGWGEGGRGEALLVIARRVEGGDAYLHGLLVAPAGF